MYMQPVGQPIAQPMVAPAYPMMSAGYPVNAFPMMAPQQFVYAAQPMMAPVYQAPPRQQKNKGNAVLFVGQLNYDVAEKDVRELFTYYGHVVNVVLLRDSKRKDGTPSQPTSKSTKQPAGTSAFVTYATTAEADLAIMSLHGRYCMDNRDKPVQVSYCGKTDIISDFGYRHALQLHAENPANPVPSVAPAPSVAYAIKYA